MTLFLAKRDDNDQSELGIITEVKYDPNEIWHRYHLTNNGIIPSWIRSEFKIPLSVCGNVNLQAKYRYGTGVVPVYYQSSTGLVMV